MPKGAIDADELPVRTPCEICERSITPKCSMPRCPNVTGRLNISIADFAEWLAALLNGKFISKDSLQTILTPTRLADGSMFQRSPASSLWREYAWDGCWGWTAPIHSPEARAEYERRSLFTRKMISQSSC